jgi:hypothetical protein
MVARETVCLRRLAGGERRSIVRFNRFFGNPKVTVAGLLEGWGEQTAQAAAGRHVLAIQDTSEINFKTTTDDRRGLGKIGKGRGYGLLLHAMLGVDAESGGCLGLVGGEIWTRASPVKIPHAKRLLADKESGRWLNTAEQAKVVLSRARMVTVVADRESDIYAEWARLPGPNFHLLTRAMSDRRLLGGGRLFQAAAEFAVAGKASIEVRERPNRPARRAALTLRFGHVMIRPPKNGIESDLPKSLPLTLVEVIELEPPERAEPIHWRLLTTHAVDDSVMAWKIVDWYRTRWTIEQLFRVLKQQGLRLEDSQLDSAERLLKLTAVATKAACTIMQLVHARDGRSAERADLVFSTAEIGALDTLCTQYAGTTKLQTNPHPRHSLAWAAWLIARLGGWDGYPKSKPPGPITFRHGLHYFRAYAHGWANTNV